MKAFYSFLLLVAVAFTACNEETTNKLIQLADGTSTSLVFNADESGDATIKFTADAAWTASVSEVAASKSGESISWLSLSPYGGEAGENTITVSLLKNYTGASRKAQIKIVCGDSEIVITVEQKGEASGGTVVKKIKEIQYVYDYNSEKLENPNLVPGKNTAVFEYDDQGRVASIDLNDDENGESKATIDYSNDGIINISVEYASDPQAGTESKITLNDKGYAVKIQTKENHYSEYVDVVDFEYTNDGRIGKLILRNEHYDEDEVYSLKYDNGYLTHIINEDDNSESDNIAFNIPEFYPNNYPNNGMIDMFAFLEISNGFNYAFWIGRVGKTGDYILEKIINTKGYEYAYIDDLELVSMEEYTPGDKMGDPHSRNIVTFDDYATIECEYDNEKNLSKLTRKLRYDVLEETYQKVVTERVVENKDGKFYVAKSEFKTEKIDEGYDYDIYTLKY